MAKQEVTLDLYTEDGKNILTEDGKSFLIIKRTWIEVELGGSWLGEAPERYITVRVRHKERWYQHSIRLPAIDIRLIDVASRFKSLRQKIVNVFAWFKR